LSPEPGIYGAGELGQALFRAISNSPRLGILPVGFIDDDPDKFDIVSDSNGFSSTSYRLPVLGTRKDIARLKGQYEIDEVYVAISNIDNATLIEILNFLKEKDVKACFVPNLYKIFIHNVNISQIGQIPIVQEGKAEVNQLYFYFKRYIDLPLAIAFIIFFFLYY